MIRSADPCELARVWTISIDLAVHLVQMAQRFHQATGHELFMRSGHRSCAEQLQLEQRGRPAAPCELSTHVICPAIGADLDMDGYPANALRVAFGDAAMQSGLRWGGGSPAENGIPSDWNHVDLGPRMDEVAQRFRETRMR